MLVEETEVEARKEKKLRRQGKVWGRDQKEEWWLRSLDEQRREDESVQAGVCGRQRVESDLSSLSWVYSTSSNLMKQVND